jgi:uncharacterized protein YdhG (YjbR/CyaY superfamily)
MDDKSSPPTTIDEYIARCPENVRPILTRIRAVIKEAAPRAVEKISYGMPGFHHEGALVWFAARNGYIGFYPTGSGIERFRDELSSYKSSKGAVRFPLGDPIPHDLIARIVKFKVLENEQSRGGQSV